MKLIDAVLLKISLTMPKSLRDIIIMKKIEKLDKEISRRKSDCKFADLLSNTRDFVYYKKLNPNKEKGIPVDFATEILGQEIEELEKQRKYYRSLLLNSFRKT